MDIVRRGRCACKVRFRAWIFLIEAWKKFLLLCIFKSPRSQASSYNFLKRSHHYKHLPPSLSLSSPYSLPWSELGERAAARSTSSVACALLARPRAALGGGARLDRKVKEGSGFRFIIGEW